MKKTIIQKKMKMIIKYKIMTRSKNQNNWTIKIKQIYKNIMNYKRSLKDIEIITKQ